ncbi:MAG: dihydrofolate reductase family protein [Bacteroidia bacterium]|nr:dihydrofolate reductase family protein [Bacteroidia bacterium]
MGKTILYIASSLDMYIAREGGEVDWLFDDGDYGYESFYHNIGITLMGKKTYEEILGFGVDWPYEGKTNYVFTRDPNVEDNDQVSFVKGDIPSFARKLNQTEDQNIWLIGGGEIIRIFLQENLVDELRLFVHPIILGKGIPLFLPQENQVNLELSKVNPFQNGLVELHYQKK